MFCLCVCLCTVCSLFVRFGFSFMRLVCAFLFVRLVVCVLVWLLDGAFVLSVCLFVCLLACLFVHSVFCLLDCLCISVCVFAVDVLQLLS